MMMMMFQLMCSNEVGKIQSPRVHGPQSSRQKMLKIIFRYLGVVIV